MLDNHTFETALTSGCAVDTFKARIALTAALKSRLEKYARHEINAEQLVNDASDALCEAQNLDDTESTQFFSEIKALAKDAARAVLGFEWGDDKALHDKVLGMANRALESRSSRLAEIAHELLWLTSGAFTDFGGFEIFCDLECDPKYF